MREEREADCWKIIYEESSLSMLEVGERVSVCVCVACALTSPAAMTGPAVSLAAKLVSPSFSKAPLHSGQQAVLTQILTRASGHVGDQ